MRKRVKNFTTSKNESLNSKLESLLYFASVLLANNASGLEGLPINFSSDYSDMSTPPGRLPSTPGGQSPRQTQKQQTAGGLTVGTIRRNNVPMVRFLDTYNTSVEIPISVLRQLPEIFGQEFENDAVEESTPDNLHRLLRPSHPAVGATGSYKGKEKRKRGPSNDAQGEDEDEDNGRKPAKKRQAKGLSSSDTDSREAHLETLYKRNGYWRSKNKDKPFLKKWMTQPNMTLEEIRMIRRNYDISMFLTYLSTLCSFPNRKYIPNNANHHL